MLQCILEVLASKKCIHCVVALICILEPLILPFSAINYSFGFASELSAEPKSKIFNVKLGEANHFAFGSQERVKKEKNDFETCEELNEVSKKYRVCSLIEVTSQGFGVDFSSLDADKFFESSSLKTPSLAAVTFKVGLGQHHIYLLPLWRHKNKKLLSLFEDNPTDTFPINTSPINTLPPFSSSFWQSPCSKLKNIENSFLEIQVPKASAQRVNCVSLIQNGPHLFSELNAIGFLVNAKQMKQGGVLRLEFFIESEDNNVFKLSPFFEGNCTIKIFSESHSDCLALETNKSLRIKLFRFGGIVKLDDTFWFILPANLQHESEANEVDTLAEKNDFLSNRQLFFNKSPKIDLSAKNGKCFVQISDLDSLLLTIETKTVNAFGKITSLKRLTKEKKTWNEVLNLEFVNSHQESLYFCKVLVSDGQNYSFASTQKKSQHIWQTKSPKRISELTPLNQKTISFSAKSKQTTLNELIKEESDFLKSQWAQKLSADESDNLAPLNQSTKSCFVLSWLLGSILTSCDFLLNTNVTFFPQSLKIQVQEKRSALGKNSFEFKRSLPFLSSLSTTHPFFKKNSQGGESYSFMVLSNETL